MSFTAKYDGVLPRTPEVRPKSEIYTPKRDDEHPNHLHMRSPPRWVGGGGRGAICDGERGENFTAGSHE